MLDFRIPSMSCGHCISVVTQVVKAVDPDARVDVLLPSRRVLVETLLPPQSMREALTNAGYPPE
jgi:copper chaperone